MPISEIKQRYFVDISKVLQAKFGLSFTILQAAVISKNFERKIFRRIYGPKYENGTASVV